MPTGSKKGLTVLERHRVKCWVILVLVRRVALCGPS